MGVCCLFSAPIPRILFSFWPLGVEGLKIYYQTAAFFRFFIALRPYPCVWDRPVFIFSPFDPPLTYVLLVISPFSTQSPLNGGKAPKRSLFCATHVALGLGAPSS